MLVIVNFNMFFYIFVFQVLSVLWNLKKIQVEDILLEFIRRNLVVRDWNQPLNSYVYSIHDLLLSNLKKKINYLDSKVQLIKYNLFFYVSIQFHSNLFFAVLRNCIKNLLSAIGLVVMEILLNFQKMTITFSCILGII